MLLVSMEGIIDKKILLMKKGVKVKENDARDMCHFCGLQDQKFKNDDIFDLHVVK